MKPQPVPFLLSCLLGLGGVTLGVVGFDAERLIGAVDDLKASQQSDHVQIVTTAGDVAELKPRVGTLEMGYSDLSTRVIKLEPR